MSNFQISRLGKFSRLVTYFGLAYFTRFCNYVVYSQVCKLCTEGDGGEADGAAEEVDERPLRQEHERRLVACAPSAGRTVPPPPPQSLIEEPQRQSCGVGGRGEPGISCSEKWETEYLLDGLN